MSAGRVRQRRRSRALLLAAVLIVIFLIGLIILLETAFEITQTEVSGCVYSDEEAVLAAVSSDEFSDNSLLLYLQLKRGKTVDAEFVESVQVKFLSPWHICLEVTEKTLYGVMLQEDGSYCYFDSSGNVIEISQTGIDDLLTLEATSSGDASVGSALSLVPSGSIDYVTQVFALTEQYGLEVSAIYLDTLGYISFDTSGITVILGDSGNTAEKFENLSLVLDQLDGKTGTLDFTAFSDTGDDIIFTED